MVPPGPVAVAVNCCEVFAVIVIEPVGATLPMPLSIVTVVALVELQVRVADPPSATLSGWIENARVGAATDVLWVLLPVGAGTTFVSPRSQPEIEQQRPTRTGKRTNRIGP